MNSQSPEHDPAPTLPPESASKPVTMDSHVTTTPAEIDGHNYDPRLRVQMANEPDVVHTTRPLEPEVGGVSEQLQRQHQTSTQLYPELNLSNGEVVLMKVHRHIIGILAPVLVTTFVLCFLVTVWIMYPVIVEQNVIMGLPSTEAASLLLVPLILLVSLFGYIAIWIYMRNTFFLTNESVIQEIQHSLFSKHEQTVSLGSIEDVSFRQDGLLQTIFNYGTIRLSTEGEETTYRFHYVSNPKQQVAVLNNAVESFKNGRPVSVDD